MTDAKTYTFHITKEELPSLAIDYIAERTDISKVKIKDAMNKGAVWLKPAQGARKTKLKEKRLRRSKYQLIEGQILSVYFDSKILSELTSEAELIEDFKHYSIWNKPPGMLSQGTLFGDHASLLRFVEKYFSNRECYLVHRLDREASGLMLVAHTRKAAAVFSQEFSHRKVEKIYHITVKGVGIEQKAKNIGLDRHPDGQFLIEKKLDGKLATTWFSIGKIDSEKNHTDVEVRLVTGRKHQIRRHFAAIGFPVLGDPRYGKNNACADGLQLRAVKLSFHCPFTHQNRLFVLPQTGGQW